MGLIKIIKKDFKDYIDIIKKDIRPMKKQFIIQIEARIMKLMNGGN